MVASFPFAPFLDELADASTGEPPPFPLPIEILWSFPKNGPLFAPNVFVWTSLLLALPLFPLEEDGGEDEDADDDDDDDAFEAPLEVGVGGGGGAEVEKASFSIVDIWL